MNVHSSDTIDVDRLRAAGLRPTYQRISVAAMLREFGNGILTAEETRRRLHDGGRRLGLATIYNALNDFAKAGLVRRLDFGERTCYCTDGRPHHHFLDTASGRVFCIDDFQPSLSQSPKQPDGMEIEEVEIIVRVRPR